MCGMGNKSVGMGECILKEGINMVGQGEGYWKWKKEEWENMKWIWQVADNCNLKATQQENLNHSVSNYYFRFPLLSLH